MTTFAFRYVSYFLYGPSAPNPPPLPTPIYVFHQGRTKTISAGTVHSLVSGTYLKIFYPTAAYRAGSTPGRGVVFGR